VIAMKKLALSLLVLGACVDTRDPIAGTQSLHVELKSPAGSESAPLNCNPCMATIDVTALDANGQLDTTYNNNVQVYVNFLGTLTPYLGGTPVLKTIAMSGGMATNVSISLPEVYGPATLFLDDGTNDKPTYAVGASPTLWFRDPYIMDIQTPKGGNEAALDALSSSPLESKQVTVNESRNGANGRLVVTSVFAQGYTISDVQCGAGGAPPCVLTPNPKLTGSVTGYDHKMIFSFSAPRDQDGRLIKEGQFITGFAGGVSEFNGLTEIGFPQTFDDSAAGGDANSARIPAPAVFDATWFTNKYMFERNEAGLIQINGAKVCDLDTDYDTYKQWKIDPAGVGGNCMGSKSVINVITNGIVPSETVTGLPGKTLPRIVGVLRPVNIGTFNVWIIYPRSTADLTLQ
jgi:hypothetical protein